MNTFDMNISGSKSSIECYEPCHNELHWLPRLNTKRQLCYWPDRVAVAEANLSLGNVPLTWFLTHCNQSTKLG